MIQTFYYVIMPVFVVLTLGFVIGKIFKIEFKTLSTISIYLLTPALIFYSIYSYEGFFQNVTLVMFLSVTVITVIIIVIVELVAYFLKMPKTTKTAIVLTLILSNSGNFGLPVCEAAYGPEGFLIASVLLVAYSFYTNTLGIFIAATDSDDRRKAFKKTLTIPFFYAFVLAMIFNYFNVEIPAPIIDPIKMVGLSAIPLNLLQLGMSLSEVNWKDIKRDIWTVTSVSVIKLAVIPFGAFFLLGWLGLDGLNLKVTLTQIAMPSAVYCSILTSHYDGDSKLASSIVLFSSLLSLITLSVLITILA
jgi:hypothetical protein